MFLASQWQYRGEGHVSLVLFRTKEPPIVLRLRKKFVSVEAKMEAHGSYALHGSTAEQLSYVESVMKPLLGSEFVLQQRIVQLPQQFVEDISKKVAVHRPSKRCCKTVDCDLGEAILMPDVCFLPSTDAKLPVPDTRKVYEISVPFVHKQLADGYQMAMDEDIPTFCVEIKPKCGFLHLSSTSRKKPSCKFCMFQILKVKNGKWELPSAYCPLDLFSGNLRRVKIALHGLLKTPQNNLKVFKNGVVVYTGDIGESSLQDQLDRLTKHFRPYMCGPVKESLVDLLARILTAPQCEREQLEKQPVCSRSATAERPEIVIANGINTDPRTRPCKILDAVLNIQRWDDLGSHGILPYYRRLLDHLKGCPDDRKRWGIDVPVSHVDQNAALASSDDGSVEYALQKVRHYLVAATAKDCSIMISIKPRQTIANACRS
ncbi:inositol-pentakisphosphate 2-kinase-like isoform X2 [Corticium candelabrum]|uniref:inositol-pentakisphosphate 2-kinase-like isoform X2 n=1 Tax=Corticium candelabrum TaxID=121492 RepID=UPI002E272B9E|nr:inositol-pentakisphosphate 2-kinase-like isoform X2 [Corticium candelabrum]